MDQSKKKSVLRFPVKEARQLEEMRNHDTINGSQTGDMMTGTLTAEH